MGIEARSLGADPVPVIIPAGQSDQPYLVPLGNSRTLRATW